MADEEELVEVGYGDDAEIVWTGGLTCLNDIDEILVGYESVEMDIAEDKLTKILDDLRNIEPSVPNAADFREASDLIMNSLIIDKTFFDPDMPNASIRLQLKAQKSEVPHLHDFVERAKSLFLQVFEEDELEQLSQTLKKRYLKTKQFSPGRNNST